ncbi:MAG TPA: non-canonical purine NTP pyrophosphatase, RdgB/HAM1 family [Methylococcaceae bacterium]|jgi:XTP/dITP diphosphohydrolase|nr:non-canonical purine NTP pyrophosphatase, RdgB/HAM1 family [Methylococcaceae bacterium]
MKKVLIASNNLGKIREIAGILAELDIVVVGQRELGVGEVEETGVTFIENAIIKARHASLCSGLPALADDSGLEVDALDGRPGVYSARFAGPGACDADNNAKLIESLRQAGPGPLTARFRCVMVYLRHPEDPSPVIGEGVWEGEILREAHGVGGFGYDPYFWVPQAGCTVAEMDEMTKNRMSHRGAALRSLLRSLRENHV